LSVVTVVAKKIEVPSCRGGSMNLHPLEKLRDLYLTVRPIITAVRGWLWHAVVVIGTVSAMLYYCTWLVRWLLGV
jgi:hypothetical protein